jgi:branched-chain amino acid transport system substrate-binding protein
VKVIGNVYGFDESVFSRCPSCIDRYLGIAPFAFYGDVTSVGMEDVVEIHDRYRAQNGEDKALYADVRYVQGYVSVLLFKIAVEQLVRDHRVVDGPNLKGMLERFQDVQTAGLTAPISFSPIDHRPNGTVSIYSINDFGKLRFEEQQAIELRPEWVGW